MILNDYLIYKVSNCKMSSKELIELLIYAEDRVKYCIANNPKTPISVLKILSNPYKNKRKIWVRARFHLGLIK